VEAAYFQIVEACLQVGEAYHQDVAAYQPCLLEVGAYFQVVEACLLLAEAYLQAEGADQ
jgi:hypothetical protein